VFAFEDMHDLADSLDAALGVLCLAVPNAPVQTRDFGDDHSLRRHPIRLVGRQIRCRLLRVLQTHRDVEPIEKWGLQHERRSFGLAGKPIILKKRHKLSKIDRGRVRAGIDLLRDRMLPFETGEHRE
jgi:hypothetical protein